MLHQRYLLERGALRALDYILTKTPETTVLIKILLLDIATGFPHLELR